MRRRSPAEVEALRRNPVDAETLAQVAPILDAVEREGSQAVRAYAERFGDLAPGAPLCVPKETLAAAFQAAPAEVRETLLRTAARIRTFAEAQRQSVQPTRIAIPGGFAEQQVAPVETAGCYAPGGRFPLPSSMLMTAVTARVAGVETVWAASPRPAPVTLAAAHVAGVDGLLAVGGAQAIAALAFGTDINPACAAIVGPGNRYVTAAKQLVSGRVAIDMLAGPSELVIVADERADPRVLAADLLAQAEHDPEALPVLISNSASLIDAVEAEVERQLVDLPTRATAEVSMREGWLIRVRDLDEAVLVSDRLAPEHLQVCWSDPAAAARFRHFGGLFVNEASGEVLGDYGAGPNHTLPTGGTSRSFGGLSVFNFLRIRTALAIDDPAASAELVEDAIRLARLEGLEAHARAAEWRRKR